MVRGEYMSIDSTNVVTRDADLQKHKDQTEVMKVLLSKYKKMELLLDAYEKTHSTMEEQAR